MNQKKKIILTTIFCLIIITLILLININNKLQKNKETTPEVIEDIEDPTIDYDNLKNAKIIDGEKVNTSRKVAEDHYILYDIDISLTKLLISNTTITSISEKDVSTFKATITNTDNKNWEYSNSLVVFTFYDKNRNRLAAVDYVISEVLKPDETIEVNITDIDDFINCYDYDARVIIY